MFLFRSAFWTTKSESLLQDLVSNCIKTILIAALAFVVMDYAKHTVDVYNRRRALVTFQNGTIEAAIAKLQAGYTERIGCIAKLPLFEEPGCLTDLRVLGAELNVQDDLVSGILGSESIAMANLKSSIAELIDAHGSDLTSQDLERLSGIAKQNLRSAINDLAREIR